MWATVAWVVALFLLALAATLVVFGYIYRYRVGYAASKTMAGKTVIVTGASAGIGKEAARDLARRGARVILACRNLKKAADVAAEIQAGTGNRAVLVLQLDTSSLASVRAFAAKVLSEEHRLDVLVLNAGTGGSYDRILTADGLESTMATNHFGHFLLANMLLGLLKASSPSRVVVTASLAHAFVKALDPKILNFETGNFSYLKAYGLSKACNILFTRHLAEMLKGTGVVVNALCPGFVATEIFEKMKTTLGIIQVYLVSIVGKTAEQGAQTILHLAVSDEAATITGQYFENCKVSNSDSALVRDAGVAKKVWEASETCVGLKPEERHF